jgi:hypothetical protein
MQREAGGRGCECPPPPTRRSGSDISGVSRRLIRSEVAVESHPNTRLDRTDVPSATGGARWISPCILCSQGGAGRCANIFLALGVSVGPASGRSESVVGRSLRPRWLATSTGCAPRKPRHILATNDKGGRCMCSRVRVRAFSLVVVLGLVSWGLDMAAAEPSALCRDVAAGFATAPAQLDARSLARLGTCVMTEIEDRAGAAEPSTGPSESTPPLPSPAMVLPPVAPSEATQSALRPRYGDWPLPAAWMEDWPSPGPWQRLR